MPVAASVDMRVSSWSSSSNSRKRTRNSMAEVVSAAMGNNEKGVRDSISNVFTSESDYLYNSSGGLDREIFRRRVMLEMKMLSMLPRFLLFLVSFLLFIAIQQVEYDPTSFSGIHLRLRDHFMVKDVFSIRQIPELMAYLDSYVVANEQLNPLDIYHWCADDDAVQLPVNRIRCNRDRGQLADKPFLEHYAVSSQRLQDAQSNALYYMVREIRDATVTPQRRMEKETKKSGKSGKRLPRKSPIALTLRSPKVAQRDAAGRSKPAAWLANTSGVVGFALNGVLLIGEHHERGKAMPTSWHFDNCGGHVDTTGHYHYHFPPSCFLGQQGQVAPGRSDWWTQEEALAYWPSFSKASKVLGYALDGVPIRGPYGADGRLVNVSELDECNGRVVLLEDGREEYHYVWSVSDPFLPRCFKLPPAPLKLQNTTGETCHHSGERSASFIEEGEHVLLNTLGCPDHPYFGEPVKVEAVSPQLDRAAALRKLAGGGCCAGNCSAAYSCSAGNCSAGSACCAGSCSAGSCGTCTGCGAGASTSAGCCAASCCAGSCGAGSFGAGSCGTCTGSTSGSCCAGSCGAGSCGAGSCGTCTGSTSGSCCAGSCGAGSCGAGSCGTGSCGAGNAGSCGTCTGHGSCWSSCGACGACGCGGCDACWTCVVDIFNPCDAGFDPNNAPDPPKQFIRYKPFSMTASSVGFPFICQSRRVEKDCDSNFVDGYNAQEPNPVYREPMNAPRNSSILRCRGEEYSTEPHLGYAPQIQDGVPYYCVFVSADILVKMMEFEWIDDLTSDVFVASFIYFPNADAISLMRLNFDFADTGRILSSTTIQTHSVLQESPRWSLYLGLMCSFLVLVGGRLSFVVLRCIRVKERRHITYDCVLTSLLFAYGIVDFLIRTVSEDTTMVGLLSLLTQILQVDDPTSRETVEKVINGSFQTLNVIKATVNTQELMKLCAYFLVFMCLLRLIQYMEVHPRVDLIARTVKAAGGDMFHFCMIFLLVFSIMAWLAHWSFGPDKIMFSTFQTSANTCFQMLIGEYPFEDEWTEGWKQKVWYVLYTFLLFLVSLNILLAIIVESFLRVKQETDERQEVKSLFPDVLSLCLRRVLACHHRWPSTQAVMQHLEAMRLERDPVSVKELLLSSHVRFTKDSALSFLQFYHWYLGAAILDGRGRAYEDARKLVLDYTCEAGSPLLHGMSFSRFMQCVIHIQSVVRRKSAYKKAARMRRQKQKQEERRHQAMKLGNLATSMELKTSPDAVVREFGSWLGVHPQVVDALLVLRAAGLGGTSTTMEMSTDSIGTQSSSFEDVLTRPPPVVQRSMDRLEFENSTTASV